MQLLIAYYLILPHNPIIFTKVKEFNDKLKIPLIEFQHGYRYSLVDMVREHIQTLPVPLLLKLIELIPHTGDRKQLIMHFIYGVDGSKGKVT